MTHTPVPLPGSKTAAIGTCSACRCALSSAMRRVTVDPNGALASAPSNTYRASKVRVTRSAESESSLSFAVTAPVVTP
ncbi:hypothetical protein D9M68_823220 [compost metagenome]